MLWYHSEIPGAIGAAAENAIISGIAEQPKKAPLAEAFWNFGISESRF